jgi:hypothetical protein
MTEEIIAQLFKKKSKLGRDKFKIEKELREINEQLQNLIKQTFGLDRVLYLQGGAFANRVRIKVVEHLLSKGHTKGNPITLSALSYELTIPCVDIFMYALDKNRHRSFSPINVGVVEIEGNERYDSELKVYVADIQKARTYLSIMKKCER